MAGLADIFGGRGRKTAGAAAGGPVLEGGSGAGPSVRSVRSFLGRLKGRKDVADDSLVHDPDLPDPSSEPSADYVLDAKGRLKGGGRRLALGLQWQPRQADKSLNAQARDSAFDDIVPTYAAVFAEGSQVGFGSRSEGARSGMTAAATAFPMQVTGDSWVGAFRLEGEDDQGGVAWWLVALRDGLVYEDRVLRDAMLAQDAFAELLEVPGWKARICPEEWDLPETVDLPLGLLLPKRPRGAILRPHDPKVIWAPRIALLLMLALLVAGALFYQSFMERQRREAEEARRRAAEEARRAALNVAPWVNTPDLATFVDTCSAAIEAQMVLPPGWRVSSLTCTLADRSVNVTSEWRREAGGRASWLFAAMAERGLEGVALTPKRDGATVTRNHPVPTQERRGEVPFPVPQMEAWVNLRFDTLSLDMTLKPGSARAAPRTAVPGVSTWVHHEFQVKTSSPPRDYAELLADIPGVTAMELAYDPYLPSWTLTALIYHPPNPVPQRR